MIFDHVAAGPGFAWLNRFDSGLPKRAGRGERAQHGRKGRFCAPKSFAIPSGILLQGKDTMQGEKRLNGLNAAQSQAVRTTHGRVLVLAGAGSGKTSVLTHRIAYLLREQQVSPQAILGLTFTNKAASEMRQRVGALVDSKSARHLTLCTFHSFCMQILRKEIELLGYTSDFSLYNEKDMKRLLTQMARMMLEHEGELPSLQPTFDKIAEARSQGVFPKAPPSADKPTWHDTFAADLFSRLEACMRAYNAVDFDSLLVLTVQLFEEYPGVLAAYQQRFQYLMIDEYQDTNPIQYRLASLLAAGHRNLCVVGDDDQSIYGWRGAEIKHILHFDPDHTIKLEQNYRSTSTILKAANAVISNNKERHPKELWSSGPVGDAIELFHAPTETEEAEAVIQRLVKLHTEQKIAWRDMAILYRSNVLARPFETALINAVWPDPDADQSSDKKKWLRGIPYQIFGGTELYERSEIKDLMAYLRTVCNPSDEEAILRIINVPRRGVSDQALDKITAYNREKKMPLWELLQKLQKKDAAVAALREELSERGMKGIEGFVALIEKYRSAFNQDPLHTTLLNLLEEIDYKKAISEDVKSDKMRGFKWENIEQYVESLKRFTEEHATGSSPRALADFVSENLLNDDHWLKANRGLHEDKLNLMTFHSAKGLEFTACFLIGLEDHIIPHEKSLMETGVEEERRLMYVAITRAKRHLCLSMARKRKKMGQEIDSNPSRFLFEIPKDLVKVTSWRFS